MEQSPRQEDGKMSREEFDKKVEIGQAFLRLRETPEWKLTFGDFLDHAADNILSFKVLDIMDPDKARDLVLLTHGQKQQLDIIAGKMQDWENDAMMKASDVLSEN